MSFVNSAKTESQIANVVNNKYSNRDFECSDSTDESQTIDIQHIISTPSKNGQMPLAELG